MGLGVGLGLVGIGSATIAVIFSPPGKGIGSWCELWMPVLVSGPHIPGDADDDDDVFDDDDDDDVFDDDDDGVEAGGDDNDKVESPSMLM